VTAAALMALRFHLTTPVPEGGHGLVYALALVDPPTFHVADHDPAAWWAEAITHTHEGAS
jgi:hypothetical protein